MKKNLLHFAIIIFSATTSIPALSLADDSTMKWGEGRPEFTKDMTPVDIDLVYSTPQIWAEHYPNSPFPAPVKLRIPKAFMYDADNWKGGYQEFVDIDVKPDLTPAALAEDPHKSFNDDLQLTLRPRGEQRFLYEKMILRFRKSYTPVSGSDPFYDEYRTPSTRNPAAQELVYIPKNANSQDAVYVQCFVAAPRCIMHDELDSRIESEVFVPNHKPEEWMKIRAAERKLVSQFLR